MEQQATSGAAHPRVERLGDPASKAKTAGDLTLLQGVRNRAFSPPVALSAGETVSIGVISMLFLSLVAPPEGQEDRKERRPTDRRAGGLGLGRAGTGQEKKRNGKKGAKGFEHDDPPSAPSVVRVNAACAMKPHTLLALRRTKWRGLPESPEKVARIQ